MSSHHILRPGQAVEVSSGHEASIHVAEQVLLPVYVQVREALGDDESIFFLASMLGYVLALSHRTHGLAVAELLHQANKAYLDHIKAAATGAAGEQVH